MRCWHQCFCHCFILLACLSFQSNISCHTGLPLSLYRPPAADGPVHWRTRRLCAGADLSQAVAAARPGQGCAGLVLLAWFCCGVSSAATWFGRAGLARGGCQVLFTPAGAAYAGRSSSGAGRSSAHFRLLTPHSLSHAHLVCAGASHAGRAGTRSDRAGAGRSHATSLC